MALYAATVTGWIKSNDGGATWSVTSDITLIARPCLKLGIFSTADLVTGTAWDFSGSCGLYLSCKSWFSSEDISYFPTNQSTTLAALGAIDVFADPAITDKISYQTGEDEAINLTGAISRAWNTPLYLTISDKILQFVKVGVWTWPDFELRGQLVNKVSGAAVNFSGSFISEEVSCAAEFNGRHYVGVKTGSGVSKVYYSTETDLFWTEDAGFAAISDAGTYETLSCAVFNGELYFALALRDINSGNLAKIVKVDTLGIWTETEVFNLGDVTHFLGGLYLKLGVYNDELYVALGYGFTAAGGDPFGPAAFIYKSADGAAFILDYTADVTQFVFGEFTVIGDNFYIASIGGVGKLDDLSDSLPALLRKSSGVWSVVSTASITGVIFELDSSTPSIFIDITTEDSNALLSEGIDLVAVADEGTFLWEKHDGPGNAVFSAPTSLSTHADFDKNGKYILMITASLGEVVYRDYVIVTVLNLAVLPH
jgi:hypothetical protein